MHSACHICPVCSYSKTSVLVKFSSAIYNVTEGMDPKVTITVLAEGAVDDADFSVRVIAKDGTATRGYILYTYIRSVQLYIADAIKSVSFNRGDTEFRWTDVLLL